jgi:hypothetical protein
MARARVHMLCTADYSPNSKDNKSYKFCTKYKVCKFTQKYIKYNVNIYSMIASKKKFPWWIQYPQYHILH